MTLRTGYLAKSIAASALLLWVSTNSSAQSLEQIQQEGEKKLVEAEQSQKRIDKIVEGAQERLIQYQALQKQIEGLKAYNEQLTTQVASQEDLITRFDNSITQVALIERQMAPLVTRMAESLEKFVELDLPFNTAERQERMAFIRENLVAADIDVAEKFRQVIEAYQIENEYGRKIDSFQDIVTLDGAEHEVDVLRVGRIALVCQTKDTTISARWNPDTDGWDVLDNVTYRNAIRNGIKMAKKQASINIVTLPIAAPEAAQ
ncbi:MAG: DUF3450 domain-containing protein [Gammaproteobacteria bacterium]